MIVRISGEGQYKVPDDLYDELNRLDNETVGAVESDDETTFTLAFAKLIELVRTRGTRLGDDELLASLVPGTDAIRLLGLDRETVEVNVTPDRGYCFSVRGVARE